MTAALGRAYDGLIMMLAILAGIMMAAVFVIIIVDVAMRTVGAQPPFFTSALSEYSLLYMTMFASPWVVRNKAHVFVESLTSTLPERLRGAIEKGVLLLCIAICLCLAYYGVFLGLEFAAQGDEDVRSIVSPRWVLYLPLPIGFGLSAVEFARFLVGRERMLSGRPKPSSEGI